MVVTAKKLVLNLCLATLFVPFDMVGRADHAVEARWPVPQLAVGRPSAFGRKTSSPPGGKEEDTVYIVSADDSWDFPDQGLGWQWPESESGATEDPATDVEAAPARSGGRETDATKEPGNISDDPDQGLGWQWPVADEPSH